MNAELPNKIHIIGSVGSGKTTLARKLSVACGIPYYELDNVVWERRATGDVRRSDADRDDLLARIVASDRWIVEGAHFRPWVMRSLGSAELILFLDAPYRTRIVRIVSRFVRQKTGRESANYTPTLGTFFKMFKWNAGFEKESKPAIMDWLHSEGVNFRIIRHDRELAQLDLRS